MSIYKTGKLPFKEKSTDLRWSELRKPIKRYLDQINLPAVFGHGGTYTDWRMLANGPDPTAPGEAKNGVGCCVVSAMANETKISITDAGGPVGPTADLFDGATTVKDYSAIAKAAGQPAYDPKTGQNDNGLEIRWRLEYQQKVGALDAKGNRHRIGPYWLLEPGNQQHFLESLLFGEALPIGVIVCQAQMDQFNEGERANRTIVWDYVKGSPEEGGHCIPECGRPDAQHIAAITWRRRIFLTEAFLRNQCDEVWSYATTERINKATGQSYEHATPAQIEEYLGTAAKKLAERLG
jgi:hypothetical protein